MYLVIRCDCFDGFPNVGTIEEVSSMEEALDLATAWVLEDSQDANGNPTVQEVHAREELENDLDYASNTGDWEQKWSVCIRQAE